MRQYKGLTKEGKWVYGWYMERYGQSFIINIDSKRDVDNMLAVILETVGQQVGFKDENNKEIYEYDILDDCWVVRFYDGHFVLCNPIDEPAKQCAKEMLDKLVAKESIVTGNIHCVA